VNKAVASAAAAGTVVASVTMPWNDIFKGVLGAGGISPALFLLVVGGLVIGLITLASSLKKERDARDTERDAAAKALNDLQEKRISEGREQLLALERTATALTAHTTALEGRTITLQELVRGVDNFARQEDINRRFFEGVSVRLEAGVDEVLRVLSGR
jgi:hypothetical protein